jgi:hypothetical protein
LVLQARGNVIRVKSEKFLSNLSIGMSTFMFDTSGTLLLVQPIKRKIKIKKNEVSLFIAMINDSCYCMLRTKIKERKF